ncbi:hypothetical protein D3C73_1321490 [compost metagenome]
MNSVKTRKMSAFYTRRFYTYLTLSIMVIVCAYAIAGSPLNVIKYPSLINAFVCGGNFILIGRMLAKCLKCTSKM